VWLWDPATGRQIRELQGHGRPVAGLVFSPDGKRLTGHHADGAARVWDVDTGQVAPGAAPTPMSDQSRSADGHWLAVPTEGTVRVFDLTAHQEENELTFRLWATRADPSWHENQLRDARRTASWYSAVHHINRLLEIRRDPALLAERRATLAEAVARNPKDHLALAAHARACLEAREVEDYQKACAALSALRADGKDPSPLRSAAAVCALAPDALPDLKPLLAAFDKTLAGPTKYPEDLRILAGLLLRAGKAEDAVKRLLEAKKGRDDTPHEDLLLALAYQQLKRPDDAKEALSRAVTALERSRRELAAGNALLAGNLSPLHLPTGLQQPTSPDWRERALGWQAWLDLQLLRREAEAALAP
jgi:tetratricopeptide (TPR) repeat protein